VFQEGFGDWRKYKDLKPQEVVDFRHADRGRYADRGPRERPYDDDMAEVQEKALKALQEAQRNENGPFYTWAVHVSSRRNHCAFTSAWSHAK